MSFWELNSAVLRERYPGLLEEICREDGEGLAPEDIQTGTAASGAPSLSMRGIHIHSPRDPEREGRRLAESIHAPGEKDGPLVILGFGLGYAASAAAEISGGRPIIIVEKYRRLLHLALELRDLRGLLEKNNIVFVPGAAEGVTAALSLFEKSGEEKIAPRVISSRALVSLDEEWYSAVEGRIRTWAMRDDINAATLKRFGRRWVRNLSRNMSAIRDLPGISRLGGICGVSGEGAALPVFLAAAGPGLDSIAALLADIHRRCVVVAVDTSLRFLLKRGIAPDFVLVVDPQFWNSRHLDRCEGSRTRLVAESAVYPPVLRLPFKGVYLCGSLFPLGSFIEQRVDPKGALGAGGSVATTAWDFARTLGAEEIWIAGLDLAFPGLKTHFRGALFEEKSHAESLRNVPAETWLVRSLRDGIPFPAPSSSGGQVLTDRRLSLYAAWFENRFHLFPHVRSLSLSSGGLAISGLENAEAPAILALPERREEITARLEGAFSRIEAAFFESSEACKRAENYRNAVSVLLGGLEKIKSAAERGMKTAKDAQKRDQSPGEQKKILAALDETTQAITRSEVKEVAGFLFPPEAACGSGEQGGDPFGTYLRSSAKLFHSLAEAAELNLRELGQNPDFSS